MASFQTSAAATPVAHTGAPVVELNTTFPTTLPVVLIALATASRAVDVETTGTTAGPVGPTNEANE